MTRQLKGQRDALLKNTEQIERRRTPGIATPLVSRKPRLLEQRFPGNDRARRMGKAQQDFHRIGRKHFGKAAPRHAALERLDEEVPEIESLQKFCFHMVAGTTVSISR